MTLSPMNVPRILVRAISEGSTVVMKAISTNDEISMKKAMATSPRGKRAQERPRNSGTPDRMNMLKRRFPSSSLRS